MLSRVVITGAGVVSAIGVTRQAFHDALARGDSAIAANPTAADDGVPLSARVLDFGARGHFEPRVLRRLARVSQMALVAAREALAHAGATAASWPGERIGVVLGTGVSTLRETIDFMNGYLDEGCEAASPLLFPASVANAVAGQTAIELGLRGVNVTINHREGSTIDALLLAADFLRLGRADALLVGGVDELSSASLRALRELARLSPTALRPYARGRDGTAPGEGAAMFLVEREDDALRRGAPILARIAGSAAGGEPRARVGYRGGHRAAVRVIGAALAEAGLDPAAIDYVAGAGSGLSLDAIEAQAVAEAVGGAVVPHGSILGQTGDFLSAAALRLAAALYALERQALPGTVGAGEADDEAPVPGLVRTARAATVNNVLLPMITQGGAASALVLAR